jgi:hypothetical protein
MDSKVSFTEYIGWKALAMLEFVKRLSCEFRDPYTLKALYVSLVRLKLEYASCVWRPFYGAHIDRIERVQEKFVRYCVVAWFEVKGHVRSSFIRG